MAKARMLWSNFSKGELSPLLEGRPDLAAYFEGGSEIENFRIMRQGGLTRRPGLLYVAEVKDSADDTILLPFIYSEDTAYVLEIGDLYLRFFKNGAPVLTSAGGSAVEVAAPWGGSQNRSLHRAQSADVMYLWHPSHQQRKLSRASDTSWTLAAVTFMPPPSYEADVDLTDQTSMGAATLTPGSNTGAGVTFTCTEALFLQGDIGRLIIYETSRAIITQIGTSAGETGPVATCVADIIDDFPGSAGGGDIIPAGEWFLRNSPQATLDPDIKGPIGALVTLVAGENSFRSNDVGKYIKIYGGLVKITTYTSATSIKGEILSEMADTTDANPNAAPAGSWTLEVESWSSTRGYPRTGGFHGGRLGQAGTSSEPTTIWFSASDDFENYAIGSLPANALEYVIASQEVNIIEWMVDNLDLFIGTRGAELRVRGAGADEPLGGDVIPLVQVQTREGSAHIQPVVAGRRILFVDKSFRKIFSLGFSLEEDGFDALELTDLAEHITEGGVKEGPIAFLRRSDPSLYFVREDGELVCMTYYRQQKVVGFTRFVTDGLFESVAVIPQSGDVDQVWVIVKRTINGATKRYVEYFEENHSDLSARAWTSLQTDCALVYNGSATTTITGLTHLEAETVDVIADGSYVGQKTVASGQITLDTAASVVEVGLHYDSTVTTMRPAVEGSIIEGLPRSWDQVFVRLKDAIGGKVNGERLQYAPSDLNELDMFTGDRQVTGQGWDTDGKITVLQDQPYPMKLLAAFGTLSVGGHD